MASKLSMDEAHRADSRLERELHDVAERLDFLAASIRPPGSKLAGRCTSLAQDLRGAATHIVRVWD